jgi:thiamine-phosphate pyrophosphorylase
VLTIEIEFVMMNQDSIAIAITHPEMLLGEADAIAMLLDEGVDYVHIRKPNMGDDEVLALLQAIPTHYHQRLTIHYHHHLTKKVRVGGLHESFGYSIDINEDTRVSKSCHSIKEVASIDGDYHYLFLSPIFNSISKENYCSPFDYSELARFLRHPQSTTQKVIALGGISIQTAATARRMGFTGYALLGALWSVDNQVVDIKETFDNFQQIREAWQNQ